MKYFSIEQTNEFLEYLQTVDGGGKSKATAELIVKDISKYLYYANSVKLDWMTLLDAKKLLQYFEDLKLIYEIGPDGRLTKMERTCDALKYLRLNYHTDEKVLQEIAYVLDLLSRWKHTLRKEKKQKSHERVEKLSESSKLDMERLRAFNKSEKMWTKFDSVLKTIEDGRIPSDADLKFCMSAVLLSSIFAAWQRPGAVKNLTLSQYNSGTMVDDVHVVTITEHKTGVGGVARLFFNNELKPKLDKYIQFVRPLLLGDDDTIDKLFILPSGRSVYKIAALIRTMSAQLSLIIPTATDVRKMGATEAAKTRSEAEVRLIAQQMSHDVRTSAKYYQHIRGPSIAKKAFDTMELIVNPDDEEEVGRQ